MIVGGALLLDRVANSHLHRLGVIAESVPNRTLSGIEEGGARISQRPKPLLERFGWPDVVAIEDDVLPAERGNVGSLNRRTDYRDLARGRSRESGQSGVRSAQYQRGDYHAWKRKFGGIGSQRSQEA